MKLTPLLLTLCALTLHAAETDWKAGVAKIVITPKEPMWMAGYAARTKPAEGTAQDLFAKALALEDTHGTRFVFVTLDLIGVPRTLRAELETRLGEAYHLPPEGLLLNVSHTHCGPAYTVSTKPGIYVEAAILCKRKRTENSRRHVVQDHRRGALPGRAGAIELSSRALRIRHEPAPVARRHLS